MQNHCSSRAFCFRFYLPMFKIILLGEPGVGKSSAFLRIKENVFGHSLQPTVGIENCSRYVKVDGKNIKISLWDTAGVERYKTITRNYYRNTHAILLMYSVNDPASLQYLNKWSEESAFHAPDALKFLVGNKIDLEHLIPQECVENFSVTHGCQENFLISAKTGEGIDDSLRTLGETLMDIFRTPLIVESQYNDTIEITKYERPKEDCC